MCVLRWEEHPLEQLRVRPANTQNTEDEAIFHEGTFDHNKLKSKWSTEILSKGNSYLTILPDHDIVTMSVTNSQHISSYTVASTRESECLNSLIQVISKLEDEKVEC